MPKKKEVDLAEVRALAAQGLSYTAIAQALGLSLNVVSTRARPDPEFKRAVEVGRAQSGASGPSAVGSRQEQEIVLPLPAPAPPFRTYVERITFAQATTSLRLEVTAMVGHKESPAAVLERLRRFVKAQLTGRHEQEF